LPVLIGWKIVAPFLKSFETHCIDGLTIVGIDAVKKLIEL
jgi:hypothetical protein